MTMGRWCSCPGEDSVQIGWLKRTAINTWLQHIRRNDPLNVSATIDDAEWASHETNSVAIDIDRALAMLPDAVRVCIVLSYRERMSHAEIAETTLLPLGTVRSHIRRGTDRLQSLLSDYSDCPTTEAIS